MSVEYIATARAQDLRAPNAALLEHAGEHAAAVARVFPRPHGPYFAADVARRHLIHVLAGRAMPETAAQLEQPLAVWSARRLLAAYMPDAPQGFIEALKRIVEPYWTRADYARLLGLLARGGEGAKAVRHAPELTAKLVLALSVLPEPLRRLRVAAFLGSAREADLVARAFAATQAAERGRVAEQIERAGSRDALFRVLIDAIGKRQAAVAARAPGADWLRPILGPKAMTAAALKYENCLKLRIPFESSGRAAYYEVLSPERGVIEIIRDPRGWRFGEMRGHANQDLSQATLARVSEYLSRYGVRPWGRAQSLVQELAGAIGW